jgi:transposase InsO family protein
MPARADGRQLKCLTIVDEWTRECLAIDVAGSIRSSRVIEVLARLVSTHGAPAFMRSDNGPEFVSNAILKWIVAEGVGSALSDPGKPWQNGTDESFNSFARCHLHQRSVRSLRRWRRVRRPFRAPERTRDVGAESYGSSNWRSL